MVKPRFCVSLSTGTHLRPKKVTEYCNIWQSTGIGGTYVSAPQVGVHPAHLSHDHECRGGKGC